MKVSQLKIWTCPFDEYLKLPGWSHSALRHEGEEIQVTKKMMLGTDVHNYILTPEEYNRENIAIVKPVASQVIKAIGPLIKYLQPELAVTAIMNHEGFAMPYKGRIDLGIVNRIVLDIKVSEQPLKMGVNHFGYDHQLTGYARAINAKVAIIIRVHPDPKKKIIEMYNVPLRDFWWDNKIKEKGEPVL